MLALIYDANFNWLLFNNPVALNGFLFAPSYVSRLAIILELFSFFEPISALLLVFWFVLLFYNIYERNYIYYIKDIITLEEAYIDEFSLGISWRFPLFSWFSWSVLYSTKSSLLVRVSGALSVL